MWQTIHKEEQVFSASNNQNPSLSKKTTENGEISMNKMTQKLLKSLAWFIGLNGIIVYGIFFDALWAKNITPFIVIAECLLLFAGWLAVIYANIDRTAFSPKDKKDFLLDVEFMINYSVWMNFSSILSFLVTLLLASQAAYLSASFALASNCFSILFRKSAIEYYQKNKSQDPGFADLAKDLADRITSQSRYHN
jgi:hypothetical protein